MATRRAPAASFLGLWLIAHPGNPPAWSPDGRVVAVIGGPGGSAPPHVVLIDVASAAERLLPVPGGGPETVAWLNAGSLVLNPAGGEESLRQLWRLAYPGGQLSRLTNDVSSYAGLSVTGDRGSLVTARSDARVSIWIGNGAATSGAEEVPPAPFPASVLAAVTVDWAADHVVYRSAVGGGRLSLMRVLPGQRTLEDLGLPGGAVRASPDGRTIVYTGRQAASGSAPFTSTGIWKADADGRNAVQLVPWSGGEYFPLVTPDNRYVIFMSARSGDATPWIVSIDGGTPRQVADVPYFGHLGADVGASPAGASLVFRSRDAQNQPVVLICDVPACANRRTLNVPGDHLHWTPDGRGVAYIDDATRRNIWVQPLDGGARRQLTRFTDRTIGDFAWSRDGTRLAVARATVTNDIVLFKGLR